jgi:hypothetical protein
MTVAAGAAVGILLTACPGETAKQEGEPPETTSPKPDTVVHESYFSSARGRAWIASPNSMYDIKHPAADLDLSWSNAAEDDDDGTIYNIVEAACTDESGKPEHCHLEVLIDSGGLSTPERTFQVKKGTAHKTYDIEIKTTNDDTHFMICKGVAENPQNDQAVKGSCDVYPVKYGDLNPTHSFCAHTEEDDGKLSITYRFTHKDCDQDSGNIHNGNGHADKP